MVENGPRAQKLCQLIKNDINGEAADQILNNAQRLVREIGSVSEPSRQGLLFGQIQSGKTNNMLMSAALASDNGYKLFIILTSDNTWLYDQTFRRITKSLRGLLLIGKDDWNMDPARIEAALEYNGLVILCTKNKLTMQSLLGFLHKTCPPSIKPVIFDDEADQASLNTLANKNNDELSAINAAIEKLRAYFERHVFVQVTATPQALFLQKADSNYAPQFTVTFEPGEGYVGGEAFFETENEAESPMRYFPDDEVEQIIENEIENMPVPLPWDRIPAGLKKALCYFFVAAGTKLLNGEGDNFAFMCHVSHLQDPHRKIESLVNQMITRMTEALFKEEASGKEIALAYLKDAYDDMKLTKVNCPAFGDVVEEIRQNLMSTSVQVLISGSSPAPHYDAAFNIIIGGNKLGRGVTIQNLLVTYYGRTSKVPQIDTMMQHSRMYGYRQKEMDVMRFYVSRSLLDRFRQIYRSDKQLWYAASDPNASDLKAIVLSRTENTLIRATRPNVVYLDSLAFYMPGKRYFPYSPKAKHVAGLDKLLEGFQEIEEPYEVSIDFLIQIINLTESDDALGGTWNDEAILTCLKNMRDMEDVFYNRGHLVVRRERNIARGTGAMLSPNDLEIYNPDGPTLTMYRYSGKPEDGWDDGAGPRWVPNLRFPNGNRYYLFSLF